MPISTKTTGKPKNIETVTKLKSRLEKATSIIFADYSRLTHKQLEDLRKLLKKAEGSLVVAKNTLLKRTLKEVNKTPEEASVTGATAVLLSLADEVLPVKILINFFKAAAAGIVKGGFLGDKQLNTSDIERLATLPSRTQLYSKLTGQLQSPVYGLHYALRWNLCRIVWTLDAVKSKKN